MINFLCGVAVGVVGYMLYDLIKYIVGGRNSDGIIEKTDREQQKDSFDKFNS